MPQTKPQPRVGPSPALRFDLIAIGTGSATNLIEPYLRRNPKARVAIIDKDTPGGICLTRGCIPTKLLTTAADMVRTVENAATFGIRVTLDDVSFARVMQRMHAHIDPTIDAIRRGLSEDPRVTYYHQAAEFVAPYTLKVGSATVSSDLILVCAGSKPQIPPIEGLERVPYHTTDTILGLTKRPERVVIVGGGYIAAEFGHFFAAMGSKVTIVGRNPRFLPDEDPEISDLAARLLGQRLTLLLNTEAVKAKPHGAGARLTVKDRGRGRESEIDADLLLIAAGRTSNADTLKPERGGLATHGDGWIEVNEHLETRQKGVWAFGDCIGRHMFKHSANYESLIVFRNAFLGGKETPDYHAVPHAVFTDPEIAGVGLTEPEARKKVRAEDLLIGHYRYEDTAKGEALGIKDCFVKVLVDGRNRAILGAHIIGPQASVLVQEVVNVMNTPGGTVEAITDGMHIHPALSEVVERAFGALRPADAGHRHAR